MPSQKSPMAEGGDVSSAGGTADTAEIVVLRTGADGLKMSNYADAIRERVPSATVVHARTPHEEQRHVRNASVVTGIGIDADLLKCTSNLELFASAFVGTGHLPMDDLAERDIIVTNAAGIHAPGIAEQTIGNMLVFARRLHEGWRRNQSQEWRHFQSFELTDSTITIVGLGSIGQAVAQRLEGFDVDTIGVRYTPTKGGPTDEVIGFDDRDVHHALARTDYLVVACPLTDQTRGLIGKAEIATLPPHAVIVNTARGPILDTDAIVDALQSESLRGVALDVTDPEPLPKGHPLWSLENALITPHTGGHTPNHWDRLADILAHNYTALDVGVGAGESEPLQNVVYAP